MDAEMIRSRIAEVRDSIAQAAVRSGRDPESVCLVVVTKTHPISTVLNTVAAGATDIGENRVQEAVPKIEAIRASGLGGCRFHLIGHLQSNKAKLAARHFDMVHSVDSTDLARTLDRFALAEGRTLDILVQVNVSGEETKSGMEESAAAATVGGILRDCPSLRVRGLMTMAPLVEDPEEARPVFRALRLLSGRIRESTGGRLGPELSMGMTNDYVVAVEEGATLVRIGSAILGAR